MNSMAVKATMFRFWLVLCSMFVLRPFPGSDAATFTLANNCDDTVMISILGKPHLSTTGFALQPAESQPLSAPNTSNWSARIWGCTTQDTALECSTPSLAIHRTTLMEVTLDANGRLDSYSFHFVHGYDSEIAVTLQPDGTGGDTSDCSSSLGTPCASTKYLVNFCPNQSSHVDNERHSKLGVKTKLLQKLEQLMKFTGIDICFLTTIWSLWRAWCYFKNRCAKRGQLAEAPSAEQAESASVGITIVEQLSEDAGDVNA